MDQKGKRGGLAGLALLPSTPPPFPLLPYCSRGSIIRVDIMRLSNWGPSLNPSTSFYHVMHQRAWRGVRLNPMMPNSSGLIAVEIPDGWIWIKSILSISNLAAVRQKLDGTGTQTWKKLHPLSERLASIGIMGDQLRAPLAPRFHSTVMVSVGPTIGSPWCRETPICQTAINLIGVFFFQNGTNPRIKIFAKVPQRKKFHKNDSLILLKMAGFFSVDWVHEIRSARNDREKTNSCPRN